MASLSDPDRLKALEASGLLNRTEQQRFDTLCQTAAMMLRVPIAMLNVLDDKQQTAIGMYPDTLPTQMRVRDTGCQEVIAAGNTVAIGNTLLDPVLCVAPITTRLGIRAYLGVPVFFDDQPIGSFCAMDYHVRQWGHWDEVGLRSLARIAGLSVERP